MNKDILKTGPQEFIKNNWSTDILSLLLKKPVFSNISQKELAAQLEAKKKCQFKLPTWFGTPNIYYPNKINIEQTSSEITAKYKAQLVGGKSLLDMTAGFGVDSFYFSKTINRVTHCEMDQDLSKIASHNFKILGIDNCDFVFGNGLEFLKNTTEKFDWIYIDPSRRHDVKGKVFRLEDCEPDILQNFDLILDHSNAVLIKTSPLLDLSLAVQKLKNVSEIHVVAVQNEVKELLFMVTPKDKNPIKIKTVDLRKEREAYFEFLWDQEKTTEVAYGNPEEYLYEPNAAILKAGAFNTVGKQFGLKKIAPHSHLYTSKDLIAFPGRTFKIQQVLPFQKKSMKAFAKTKANITTRNFPETVAKIREKNKILNGGQDYLFFTTNTNGKRVVMRCKKEQG